MQRERESLKGEVGIKVPFHIICRRGISARAPSPPIQGLRRDRLSMSVKTGLHKPPQNHLPRSYTTMGVSLEAQVLDAFPGRDSLLCKLRGGVESRELPLPWMGMEKQQDASSDGRKMRCWTRSEGQERKSVAVGWFLSGGGFLQPRPSLRPDS